MTNLTGFFEVMVFPNVPFKTVKFAYRTPTGWWVMYDPDF